jgi:hypothetical protein
LDRHDFKGIFLGYTATDQNIVYLDLDLGVVKCSHHAQFDEAWYLQPTRPPAPQLLYDLGVTHEETEETEPSPISKVILDYRTPGMVEKVIIPWPPIASNGVSKLKWDPPTSSLHIHLLLRALTEELPCPITACAARAKSMTHKNIAVKIRKQDMALVYMSPNPYHEAFEQTMDLRKFDWSRHPTAGLELYEKDGRVHLAKISPSSPAAKIHEWRSRIQGAWLIQVDKCVGKSIDNVVNVFNKVAADKCDSVTLIFAHP